MALITVGVWASCGHGRGSGKPEEGQTSGAASAPAKSPEPGAEGASGPAASAGDKAAGVPVQPPPTGPGMVAIWGNAIVQARAGRNGVLEAALRLEGPKLRITTSAAAEPQPEKAAPAEGEKGAEEAKPQTADQGADQLAAQLRAMLPVDVDRIEMLNGEISVVDLEHQGATLVWMHDVEVAIENVSTRPVLSEGRPILVTASARVQKTGQLTVFLTVDPWGKGLNLAGRASLTGLATADLYQVLQTTSGLRAPKGSIDVFVEFEARDGQLTGGVKPILRNVEIRSADAGAINRLKAWAADTTLDIFSDRVPGREAVATVVPIQGRLDQPQTQVWATVVGILRNAFVEGIAAGFTDIPPGGKP